AFQILATFRLKSALMIGASGGAKSDADKASIQSNGHYVIPGKSIRGAIRQRARRILAIWKQQGIQLSAADGKDLTSGPFGFVKQDGTNQENAGRGLIRVEEATISKDAAKPMLQNRIRIDRFTGGVIDGALFNSEPVWTTDKEDLQLTFTMDSFSKVKDESTQKLYKKLLLMLLKDLWTGDLPIGGEKNIGRGVLQGKKATIIDNNQEVAIFTWADEGKTAEALTWTKGKPEDIHALIA
ncbi:MAG TPA: RAMP superfamily CRISPR-associated protein, partial [Phnomibacter sp.]|nr:RAMP superfamily CRISPR-associated protein [Phnomibacter sp.]